MKKLVKNQYLENFAHALCLGLILGLAVSLGFGQNPADLVNPLMGTAPLEDITLYGGPNYKPDPEWMGFSGTVYPGPDVPNGMVQLSPYNSLVATPGVSDVRYASGYLYTDSSILGWGISQVIIGICFLPGKIFQSKKRTHPSIWFMNWMLAMHLSYNGLLYNLAMVEIWVRFPLDA